MWERGSTDIFTAGIGVLVTSTLLIGRAESQRPLPVQEQSKLEALARESADAAAAGAKAWLGNMHPAGRSVFHKWAVAVYSWKRERDAGAAPLLAEGVLLDCLGRTRGLYTGFGTGRAVDPRLQRLGARDPSEVAARLFEEALKEDSHLIEARFRVARIRASADATAAVALEQLALSGAYAEVAYLAAVSRAMVAQEKKDAATAIGWFEHARTIRPASTAAAVGLSILRPTEAFQFERLEPDDPFYSYPCRFLTPAVGEALASRIANLEDGR